MDNTTDQSVVASLLTKMGVSDPHLLNPERALGKLKKKIAVINEQNGTLPKDVTDDEAKLAVSLGYIPMTTRMAGTQVVVPSRVHDQDQTGRLTTEATTVVKHLVDPDEAPPADPFHTPRLYRLPPDSRGVGERIEEIPPAIAASRNARRNDGRTWEPYDKKALTAKPITTSGPTTIIPVALTTESENDVSKKNKKAKGGATASPLPASYAKKASDKIKVVKAERKSPRAPKPPKKPKAPKVAKADRKPGKNPKRQGNGGELMRKIFHENGVSIDRDKLIEKLMKAGISQQTCTSYISWAKRTNPDTPDKGNPFGFVLEEEKDGGDKTLTRVKALAAPAPKAKKERKPKVAKAAKPRVKKAAAKKEPKAEAATAPEEPTPSLAAAAV